jgi:Transcriptional regulatory protein, C terminal.
MYGGFGKKLKPIPQSPFPWLRSRGWVINWLQGS